MSRPITVLHTEIDFGLECPIKLLQMTDTHITLEDEGQRSNRHHVFNRDYENCCIDYYLQTEDYAIKNGLTVLHTGDFCDFFSVSNFAFMDEHLSKLDCIYTVGNHEFRLCRGAVNGNAGFKPMSLPNDLCFYSRIIGGVNVVALGNGNHQISPSQLGRLKAEVSKGYPILLAMHVPIFTPRLGGITLDLGREATHILAAPAEFLKEHPPLRKRHHQSNADTCLAVEYIKSEPMIKAVIAGHSHINLEEELRPGLPQILTDGTFAGFVREITVR